MNPETPPWVATRSVAAPVYQPIREDLNSFLHSLSNTDLINLITKAQAVMIGRAA